MNTDWKGFRLVPDDVLFFRDGKPSSRGADHYLRSLFPPHPSTLYGALRTRRLLDEGISLSGLDRSAWCPLSEALRAELGEWGEFGSMAVRGPWLVRGDEPLMPAPADLGIKLAEQSETTGRRAKPRSGLVEPLRPTIDRVARYRSQAISAGGASGAHSHGCALLRPYERRESEWLPWPQQRRDPRPAAGWYLTPAGFAMWRQGGVPEVGDFVHYSELWTDEARTGLGLETNDRLSEEHMLYTFGFVRLRPGVAIGFEARGTGLRPRSRVRLGGEARTALLDDGPLFPALEDAQADLSGTRFRLVLATPALSRSGAYLPGFSPGVVEGCLAGRRCRLVGSVVGGFVLVGGWDLANARAKPLRRAMPAGSVFIFEDLEGGTAAQLDGTCTSDFDNETLAAQGYGLLAAGIDS